MDNAVDVGAYALGGVGVLGVVVWGVKHMIIQAFSGKSAIVTVQAGDTMITRLEKEIQRLENIIAKLHAESEIAINKAKAEREAEFKKLEARVSDLEKKLEILHDLEIQDAADIAELTILLDTSCDDCPESSGAQRMKPILTRMRQRKADAKKA